MSDRLEPCRCQPVDQIGAEHQETVEALRRFEIDLQCKRDRRWWNLGLWRPFGPLTKAEVGHRLDLKQQFHEIDSTLMHLMAILTPYYKYPPDEEYFGKLGTLEDLPILGHYYNAFWGRGYDKCPENREKEGDNDGEEIPAHQSRPAEQTEKPS